MILSFKFSLFELELKHSVLEELGNFTIFCLKAINSKMSIDDISNIIQIPKNVVEKQLTFAISRKYVTDDFQLTPKGLETVELFEFINIFNKEKVKIALEHYVEATYPYLYLEDYARLEDSSTGYLVKDNLYDYKIQNKFDEMIEDDKSRIKELILIKFENYKDIIEQNIDDFIFTINMVDNKKFYNYEIDKDVFVNELLDKKSCIAVDIPIVEIKKTVTSKIMNKKDIAKIQSKFDNYKYFNLINGELCNIEKKNQVNSPNIKIDTCINYENIIEKNSIDDIVELNELLYLDLKTDIKDFYITKYFNLRNIMDEL